MNYNFEGASLNRLIPRARFLFSFKTYYVSSIQSTHLKN